MVKDKSRDGFAMLLQGFDRGLFILAHQAAVPLDISAENSGELALNRLCGHEITPLMETLGEIKNRSRRYIRSALEKNKSLQRSTKTSRSLDIGTFWKPFLITSPRRLSL
jgi:hypothetical protein